jgi:hypothetical protein
MARKVRPYLEVQVTIWHWARDRVIRFRPDHVLSIHCVIIINNKIYAPQLMSSTAHAVKNAAAALKKATDPWNKEGRETAERIVSAAISVVII